MSARTPDALTPTEVEADRNAAEARKTLAGRATYPQIDYTERLGDDLAASLARAEAAEAEVERLRGDVRDLVDEGIRQKRRAIKVTAERDALRAQVAAVAALAHSDESDRFRKEAALGRVTLPYASNRYMQLLDRIRAALDNPDRVLRDRDAEKWDEGNAACCSPAYKHLNPYREGSKA